VCARSHAIPLARRYARRERCTATPRRRPGSRPDHPHTDIVKRFRQDLGQRRQLRAFRAAQLSATVRPVDGYISWFDRVVSCASVHCCRSSRLLHGYRRGSMANRWSRTAGARVVIRDAASAMRTFDLRQRRGHWVSGLEGRPLVSRARRSKRGSRLPDHILAVSVVRMAFGLFSARTSPKVAGIVPIDLGGVLRVISRRVCKAEENMD
jgi:hypothetical protein